MKALIRFFYEQKLLGNIITVMVLVTGVYSLITIRRDLFPPVDFDVVIVSATFSGGSPEQVEKLLVNPLEQAVREVDGIKKVQSTATKGRAVLTVTLNPDARNTANTISDIQRAIDRVENYPKEADRPDMRVVESGQTPVIAVALSSSRLSQFELRERTRQLADKLEFIPGVAAIKKVPWPRKEIVVSVQDSLLQKNHVSLGDVISALKNQNVQLPGGDALKLNGREISVKTDGEFRNPKDVANTVIRSNIEGYAVRVSDVASVSYALEKPILYHRSNGVRAFTLTVVKNKNADALKVVERVRALMSEISKDFPEGMDYQYVNNFTEYLKNRINILGLNMLVGIALVFFCALAIFTDTCSCRGSHWNSVCHVCKYYGNSCGRNVNKPH